MDSLSTHIITTYTKIVTFVFRYLVFLVMFAVGILLFQYILLRAPTIQVFYSSTNFTPQKNKLIAEFTTFMKQNISSNDMEIHILQGDLEIEQGFIKSVNNLISYKGFTLPKYFYVYGTIPTKHIDYFGQTTYELNELEHFINTFVFTKKFTITKPFTRVSLPITQSIVDDFNIGCVFENKLSSRTCNIYLNIFLDSFFVYDISKDYEGMKNILDTIQKHTVHKNKFCQGLSKYLLYANDHSDKIANLFASCGNDYSDLFKTTTFFMEVQQSLDTQIFNKIVYKDKDINTYKLLSYQQQLYQDFLISKSDTHKITMYLDFVKELLKKDALLPFYKDEIYWFNNKYLAPNLEKLNYQSATFSQTLGSSKIASLLTMISTINEGEPILGVSGLITQIHNPQLIHTNQNTSPTSTSELSLEEKIKKKLQSATYLRIETLSISQNIVDIVGVLTFSSPESTENIKTHMIIEYINDILIVKSAELQNKAGINEVIANILRIQHFSLGELYSYISKNLVFYEQDDAPIRTTNDLCPSLASLPNIQILSCTNNEVHIEKNAVRYLFAIKNGGLEHISISDSFLENEIKSSYASVISRAYTITDTITSILAYQPQKKQHEGTTNAIIVFEHIQKYIGVKPNDIADKDGKIFVDITLGGIHFIVNYQLSKNTMGPWYFKDILLKNAPYPIKNFDLVLDDANQNTIHAFVINPLGTIQTVDLTAWQNYRAAQINN